MRCLRRHELRSLNAELASHLQTVCWQNLRGLSRFRAPTSPSRLPAQVVFVVDVSRAESHPGRPCSASASWRADRAQGTLAQRAPRERAPNFLQLPRRRIGVEDSACLIRLETGREARQAWLLPQPDCAATQALAAAFAPFDRSSEHLGRLGLMAESFSEGQAAGRSAGRRRGQCSERTFSF